MQLKLQWLQNRKHQLLSELADCDTQVNSLFTQSSALLNQSQQAFAEHKQKSQLTIKELQNSLAQSSTQVKALESVILAKEDQMERLKEELNIASKGNHQKGELATQYSDKIRQLEHLIKVVKEQKERNNIENEKKMRERQEEYRSQIQKIVEKYTKQLEQQQIKLTQSHQQSITELKRANLILLEKIENEHEANNTQSASLFKQTQASYARLTQQHSKLTATLNDYKSKLLNTEGSLNNSQQQLKLMQKQNEIVRDQLKREINMLKEQKNDMKARNRKLNDKIDELTWQVKQLQLQKEQQMKKIKQQVNNSFNQINNKAAEELKLKQKELQLLKHQLCEKESTITQLQNMALKLKQIVEQQEQQIAQNTQNKKPQEQEGNTEDLKRQLVRKGCEVEVLKEEIKRLKGKVNTIAAAYQAHTRNHQQMQKQNKMLLSQIVFLRQKQKQKQKGKKPNPSPASSRVLDDLNSERSQICEDVQQYKKLIQFMTEEMNEAHKKLMDKDMLIDKLKEQIRRYERELQL